MIEKIISFSLKQRGLMITAVAALVGFGLYAYHNLAVDAFPDVTNIQVLIISEAPGRSPVEVEKFVTYPIETQMLGAPGLKEVRSLSKFGISLVTVVFEDEVDIYFARQLILERLIEAKEKLPAGIKPVMGPSTTGLGEIYQYTLEKPDGGVLSQNDLMELRTVQDWIIKPILKTVPGVLDVNSWGGMVKQYQVIVEPEKLRKYDLSLREVFEAVSNNNANAGGNIIEHSSEQYIVRGIGLITSIHDLKKIVIKAEHGTPVYVKDVAEVKFGPGVRPGAAVKNGEGEAVVGMVMMVRGGSGKEIVSQVKKKVEEINTNHILPRGLKIKPFYDRTELVEKCIRTITRALEEGAILVIIVLYLFLRSLRGAMVVAVTLPLAVLSTFIIMNKMSLSANLMSLGGLAISLGMIVDAAIIQVENVQRHLAEANESNHKLRTVLSAVLEVRKPSLFGELIIALTFIPIMTLQGMEGKMFSPLAFTVAIALLSSLILSIFVIPVLCSFFLKAGEEKEPLIIHYIKRLYLPVLRLALRNRTVVIVAGGILFLASLGLYPFLGKEFIPIMDEGSLNPQVIRLPSVSLTESIEIEKKVHQALLRFPETEMVVSKIGSPELATDPMGPNLSDPFVVFKPQDQWKSAYTKKELVEKIREELEKIPGIGLNITQPIALRVDELISGVKSQLAIKIFGDDLEILREKAEEVAKVVTKIRGVADLRVEQISGQPYLTIQTNRDQIARYGINVAAIHDIIETAVGGKVATEVLEGDKRFAVLLRYPEEKRNSVETIGNILVKAPNGSHIPLTQVAKISLDEGPVQISRENSKRRIVVECNVVDRDIGSFVDEAQEKIKEAVNLPPGYYMTWGGAFENQQRAMKRLMFIIPVTIVAIFILLFMTFNSVRYATLVILTLPFALTGGILSLLLSGQYLSVPASVGFISLFGVAVLNGMVLISYINQLRLEGMSSEEAVIKGCERRLRPVLMTALVGIFALIPLLFATGPGSEIQKPLASVVVGGLITSTLLTLILLPILYQWFEEEKVKF